MTSWHCHKWGQSCLFGSKVKGRAFLIVKLFNLSSGKQETLTASLSHVWNQTREDMLVLIYKRAMTAEVSSSCFLKNYSKVIYFSGPCASRLATRWLPPVVVCSASHISLSGHTFLVQTTLGRDDVQRAEEIQVDPEEVLRRFCWGSAEWTEMFHCHYWHRGLFCNVALTWKCLTKWDGLNLILGESHSKLGIHNSTLEAHSLANSQI